MKEKGIEEKSRNGEEKGSSNLIIQILNGGIFSNRIVTKNLTFIIYIAGLAILYIMYNYAYNEYAYSIKMNEKVITNLLSDYNSRNAELLRYSRKDTVRVELKNKNSELIEPVTPPIVIKMKNN